jgi:hypothetical protein
MILYRSILTGILITVMAGGYVHQKVEIMKAGYTIQKSRKHLSYLVDQNSRLTYNLSKLESPRNLLTSMDGEQVKFANHRVKRPESFQIAQADLDDDGANSGFVGRILDLFTVSAEARPRK